MNNEPIPNIMAWLTKACCLQESKACKLTHDLYPVDFMKREALVKEGEKCGKLFFIEKGMTRSYWLAAGEEITTSFSTEGHLVFSMDEVYYDAPSEEFVEAVEPVRSYALSSVGFAVCLRMIKISLYGGRIFISRNIVVCIGRIKSDLRLERLSAMKRLKNNFLMFAVERDLEISLLI